MDSVDQPQLNCPACGYSLRGIEPQPPALSMRCPECGEVTSIQAILKLHARRREELRRLPMTIIVAVPIAILGFVALEGALSSSFARDPQALIFAFAYGCLINGILTIAWRDAPWLARFAAIGGGGLVEAVATAYLGIRFGTLPMLAWCVLVHQFAKRRAWT